MRCSLRTFASLVVFAFSASPVFAADPPSYAVEAGANLNTLGLRGADVGTTKARVKAGLIVGGFVSVPVAQWVAIQPEVVYAQKHSKLSDSDFAANYTVDFVEVPVLVKFTLVSMKKASFYAVAGPGFSFATRARVTDPSGTQPDENIKGTTTSPDVSLVVGAGVRFGKYGIEGRYDGGLRNLNKDTDASTFKIKTRTATVLFRWSFK